MRDVSSGSVATILSLAILARALQLFVIYIAHKINISLIRHTRSRELGTKSENSQREYGIHSSAIHQTGLDEVSCQGKYISSTE